MLQFYFLSILTNLLIGLILIFTKDSSDTEIVEADENENKVNILKKIIGSGSITDDALFYLILGIVSCFTGLVKLLCAVNGCAVFGDLLPALGGIIGGSSILILYFEKKATIELSMNEMLKFILVQSRKIIGIVCLVIALLHFILPEALFL